MKTRHILTLLPAIATATGHPEIAHAQLVLSGNSAAGEGAVAMAISNPTNIIAIVATHGAMLATGNNGFNVNRGGDTPGEIFTINAAAVAGVPQVHTFDNGDGFVSPVKLQGWVEYGRSLGAPWYFLIHNDGNHTDHTIPLRTSIFPWLAAILDLRLPASGGTGDGTVTLISIVAPSGIVADLTILDPLNNDTASGTGWKLCANLKQADQMASLVKFCLLTPPAPASSKSKQ